MTCSVLLLNKLRTIVFDNWFFSHCNIYFLYKPKPYVPDLRTIKL